MINHILNAYEETKRQNEGSFYNVLKCAEIGTRIYFIFYLMCVFTMIIALVLKQMIFFLCVVAVLFITFLIWTVWERKRKQKKWDEDINKYQGRLDMIREILSKSEFNMYEKNKLRQLIRKFKVDIDNIEKKNSDTKRNYSDFWSKYITPVIAFCAGNLSHEMTGESMFVICLVVIVVIILVKIIISDLGFIQTEIIEGNEIERKQDFVRQLQDLLDRDFPIEEGDLL